MSKTGLWSSSLHQGAVQDRLRRCEAAGRKEKNNMEGAGRSREDAFQAIFWTQIAMRSLAFNTMNTPQPRYFLLGYRSEDQMKIERLKSHLVIVYFVAFAGWLAVGALVMLWPR